MKNENDWDYLYENYRELKEMKEERRHKNEGRNGLLVLS
jgi:hypothetical protein